MKRILAAVLFAFALPASADLGPYTGVTVERIVDADTLEVRIQTWLDQYTVARVRLRGVNAPELHAAAACEREAARKAVSFVSSWIAAGGTVDLTVHGWDKFGGRVLGTITRDGRSLADDLVQHGHARPYQGARREAWC